MRELPGDYARRYLAELKGLMDRLPLDALDRVVALIEATSEAGGRIFVIGNGGSAATASHLTNDLSKGTLANGDEGSSEGKRFRVVALTDNVSVLTAWANDAEYSFVFSEQLKNLAQAGDLLVAISTSGNSANVVAAVDAARQMGVRVIGLTGFDGGRLARLADVAFVVPSGQYGPVEDVHLILNHIITGYLLEKRKAAHAEALLCSPSHGD